MQSNVVFLGVIWSVYLGILLPFYLIRQSRHGLIKAMPSKLSLSFVFCVVGFGAIVLKGPTLFSALITMGLVASFVGDYYLIYIQSDERKFIKGIVFFGTAHLFYIVAMVTLMPIRPLELIMTFGVLVLLYIVKKISKPKMGSAELPMMFYSVLVTFMTVKASTMLMATVPPLANQWLFSAGALLFLISDLCLGVWRYVLPKKALSQVVAITYFIGQLMMATVLYFQ